MAIGEFGTLVVEYAGEAGHRALGAIHAMQQRPIGDPIRYRSSGSGLSSGAATLRRVKASPSAGSADATISQPP